MKDVRLMSSVEEEYLGVLSDLVHGGVSKPSRNGEIKSRWGRMLRHDMRDGFPLLSSKKVYYKGAIAELIWILNGRTDLQYLHDHGVKYWDLNYDQSGRSDGDLGPVYGKQMRDFNGVDQLIDIRNGLQYNPTSRRHLINLWNPVEKDAGVLPCCWYSVQFNVEGEYLDLLWNQRSADWFLGVPFDLVMMATFLHMMAKGLNYKPRYVVGSFADTHLYTAHTEQAIEQLSRVDMMCDLPSLSSPGIWYDHTKSELHIPQPEEIIINNYQSHGGIKAELL